MKYLIDLRKEGVLVVQSKPKPREGRRPVRQSLVRSDNLEGDLAAAFSTIRPEGEPSK